MPAKALSTGNPTSEPDAASPSTASVEGGSKKAASRGRSNSKKGETETNAQSTGNAETAKTAANATNLPANESTPTDAAASKKGETETNAESTRNAETANATNSTRNAETAKAAANATNPPGATANTTGSAGPMSPIPGFTMAEMVATNINWESWSDLSRPYRHAPTMTIQEFLSKHHPRVNDTLLTRFLVAWAAKGIPIRGTEEEINDRVRIFMEEKKNEDASSAKPIYGAPAGAGGRDIYNDEGGYDSEGEPVTTAATATQTRVFTFHKKVPKVVPTAVVITPVEHTYRTDMKTALLTYMRAVQSNITLIDGNKGMALSPKAVRWFGERDKAEGLEMAWSLDRNEKWRTACNDMAEEGGYSGPEGQEMYNMAVRAVVLATSTVNMKANGGQVTIPKVQHFLDRADQLLGKGTVGLALNKSEQQALESLAALEDQSTQYNTPTNAVGLKRPQSSDHYQNQAQRSAPTCWSCGKQGHQSTICNRFDRRLPFKPR